MGLKFFEKVGLGLALAAAGVASFADSAVVPDESWNVVIVEEAAAVYESVELKQLDRTIVDSFILTVMEQGLEPIRLRPDIWNEHALTRDPWKGFSAVNFSQKGRIIFSVHEDQKTVMIHRISADHDYSPPGRQAKRQKNYS